MSPVRRLTIATGLVVLPALLAVIAAEVALTIRARRPAHIVNGHVIAPFPSESEAAVRELRRRGVAAYPFVAPQQFAFRGYARSNEKDEIFPLSGISLGCHPRWTIAISMSSIVGSGI